MSFESEKSGDVRFLNPLGGLDSDDDGDSMARVGAENLRLLRRLVKEHHPDLGGSAAAFRRVMEAYHLLVG